MYAVSFLHRQLYILEYFDASISCGTPLDICYTCKIHKVSHRPSNFDEKLAEPIKDIRKHPCF